MIAVPISPQPRVSIVIVTARQAERLLGCLAEVARCAPPEIELEVIVVLNAAEPALHDALHREVRGAKIVASDVPLGFAGGINLGAGHAGGELLHILHDDATVTPGWLNELIGALDEQDDAGAMGSLLVRPDETIQSAGQLLWRDGTTERPPSASMPDLAGDAYVVDYCPSASLLVRRAAWDAIGGADEELHPAYFIDVDIAMALRAAGYVVMCAPASRVVHASGGTSRAVFSTFAADRNRDRFVAKWTDDLEHQEVRGDDPQAHRRAREATERRARTLDPRRADGAARRSPGPESEQDRMRREHEQLRRDLALKDAYIPQLERTNADAEARLEAMALTLEEVWQDRAWVREKLEEIGAVLGSTAAEGERLRFSLQQAEHELEELRRRAQTLDAIEGGRWWRLRTRLLPVLSVARRITRRASTSRTG